MEISEPAELKLFPSGRILAGRYEIISTLGWGGMGLVVKAKDNALNDEIVAIKILFQNFAKNPDILARFRREVILSRRLSHPNIVRVYDLGDAGNDEVSEGTHFISMEYVEGEALSAKIDRCQEGGLPFNESLQYLYQVALGLEYAHSHGVIHRDLKPDNMLITAEGVLKLSDFGVARSLDSTEKLTRTNEAIGSPIYMSPEQLRAANIDHVSDIYCLGILAFEIVEGVPPFYSSQWVALAAMHFSEPIPKFKSKDVPFWYQDLVRKAAAKEAKDRFQSARELLNFIAAHSGSVRENYGGSVMISAPTNNPMRNSLVKISAIAIIVAILTVVAYLLFLLVSHFSH